MTRLLGLDVGSATIGVAVSDPLGLTAQGLATLARTTLAKDMAALRQLIDRHGVGAIVVGWPRCMDGSEGSACALVGKLARRLARDLPGMPVLRQDERLSTVAANRVLIEADLSRRQRRRVVDKMAAALILQLYMDTHRTEGEPA